MSRYVNIEPYEDCKIVLHKEDEGICCRDLPTAVVAEVKHGHWLDKNAESRLRTQSWCSACGKRSGIGGIESNRHKAYCPNCGAKMNEGEDKK